MARNLVKDDCIAYSKIKSDRGWTDKLIEQFLGEPDHLKTNPMYKKAAPMRLYLLDRVTACEGSEAFKEARAAADRRKENAAS